MIIFDHILEEGRSFKYNGHIYSSGFGRYTKDKKSITKDEYIQVSNNYKSTYLSPEKSNGMNINSSIVKISEEDFKKEIDKAFQYVSAFDLSNIQNSKYKNTVEYKKAKLLRDKLVSGNSKDIKLEVICLYNDNCSDYPLKHEINKFDTLSRMYGYNNCITNDKNRYTGMIKNYITIVEGYYDELIKIKQDGYTDKNTLNSFENYKNKIEKYQNIVLSVLQDYNINSMKYSPSYKSIMINDMPIKKIDEKTKKIWMMVSDVLYRCIQLNPIQQENSSGKIFIDMDIPEKVLINLSTVFPNLNFILKK